MELKVNEVQLPEEISFNYEELKGEIMAKAHDYEVMVYTDDQIKEAKADRAKLNSLKKALNDERIRREKEYMTPFNVFKNQINEIIAIIDKPVGIIDKQVKEYEAKKDEEKRNEIKAVWEELEKPEWLSLKAVWNAKWGNATYTMKKIKEEMERSIEEVNEELKTLESLEEFSFEAIEHYKVTLDLGGSIAEGKRLADIQKRKEEAEKARAEAEAKRQAELYARAQEEVKRAEAEAQKPVEVVNIPANEEPKAEMPVWIAFRAYLTTEKAQALKSWCDANGVELKPFSEDWNLTEE